LVATLVIGACVLGLLAAVGSSEATTNLIQLADFYHGG
jgi:hypothetical protein